VPEADGDADDVDTERHGSVGVVRLVPVRLRSQFTWYEMNGFLAVHYIGGEALHDFDALTGTFINRAQVMFVEGLGWVYGHLRQLPPNRGDAGEPLEAFGVRVYLPGGSMRPVANTPAASPRSRLWKRDRVAATTVPVVEPKSIVWRRAADVDADAPPSVVSFS
jgi:hypothetical protein